MKKFFYSITAFIISLSFAACSGAGDIVGDDTSSSPLSDPFENTLSNNEVTDNSQESLNELDILA